MMNQIVGTIKLEIKKSENPLGDTATSSNFPKTSLVNYPKNGETVPAYSMTENNLGENIEIIETSGEFSTEPAILPSNLEDVHIPIDTNAWTNLTVQTEGVAASTSGAVSNLWADFQEKVRHRAEMERN